MGVSLVVQWLRIHLAMHRTPVRSLVWEDPARSRATKPLRHKDRAHELQLLKSKHPKAHALTRAAAAAAVTSVVSDSVRPHRRQPTRLLCPWGSPGKNTGVGCHFLLYWNKRSHLNEKPEHHNWRVSSALHNQWKPTHSNQDPVQPIKKKLRI